MTKQEKLESLRNRRTRYEIIAQRGQESVVVGFTARKSRIGILNRMRANAQAWIDQLGIGPDDIMTFNRRGLQVSGWDIRFSGRTERDTIISNG